MNRAERIRQDALLEEPIEFYGPHRAYGWMSNFSHHEVILPHPFTGELVKYSTGEHRYQALKGLTEEEHDWVAAATTPSDAKARGRKVNLRPDWGDSHGDLCWFVMFELVIAKTLQHPDINEDLKRTGTRAIWEDSPTDDIWGIRYRGSYRGKNLLGRTWMQTRLLLHST